MLITIIIPTYNRASIISKTLDSIKGQSFREWNCYVVDDHSTDNTREIVEGYINQDSRFHYLVNERKKGAQGARNTGLYQCNSEWVYFFDSDNILHSNCLKELAAAINEDIDVVQCFSDVLNIDTGERKRVFNWINNGEIHNQLLCAKTYVDFNHAIIRRSKLINIGGLDEDCPCMQEWDTHVRFSKVARYTTVEKVLVDYFVGGHDAISSNPKRDVIGKLYVLNKNIEEWRLYPKQLKHFIFYLSTIIDRIQDSQFRKESYNQLVKIVPRWYVFRGRVLSFLLRTRDLFKNK